MKPMNETGKPMSSLIAPYGGVCVDLEVTKEMFGEEKERGEQLPSIQISSRVQCDLELLAVGAFSPLDTFMGQADFQRVLDEMRLEDGTLFPIPITLPVADDVSVSLDSEIALRSAHNELLAILRVEEVYEWDSEEMSTKVFGTRDFRHPLVAELPRWGKRNLSGTLRVIQRPRHLDFQNLRLTPAEVRERLEGTKNVVAFQTRNPLHRAHEEMIRRAVDQVEGTLLLHPVVGMTRSGDIDHYTRVRSYITLLDAHFDSVPYLLALLPLAMRMAGPREALWHAIIRRNYGANAMIVGRDHASPGVDSKGQPFYGPFEAQDLVRNHAEEVGVSPLCFSPMVYLPDEERYEEVSRVEEGVARLSLSGTEVRDEYLDRGRSLPEWCTRPEVARVLADVHQPKCHQGVCIWLTGLSGAGKSVTAENLAAYLLERGRRVTLLDGDVIRTHLSHGLGFSREDRDTNIRRIGYVASEIVRHGGCVVCAAISPYRSTRGDVRARMERGHFVEVFVDTPLEVCESRDTKGLYAKARRGEITGFTGIDDPYESPRNPEIRIETVDSTAQENARSILQFLIDRGFVHPE